MAPASLHTAPVGSGKVTDSQVAFMVECYLRDSHFSRTLEEFRLEAARLLHPLRAVPKGAKSLSAVLNDYVVLKEEQISSVAEKARVEDLVHGLQEILSVYVSGATKSTAVTGEFPNREVQSHSVPPSHVAISTPMQNVHYFGSSSLEASINFGDQNARHKVLSSKRKSMDNSNAEVLQQGDPVIDLTKKTRRVSNVAKRLPTDHHLGRATDVGSPRVGMVQSAIKAVQPSTPSSILSNAKSQQQQANASCGSQGSPQHVPQMDARSNLVSPNRASTISASSSSAETDCAQTNHHDPQTPPPVKYSVAENCMSGSITSTVRQDNATRPEEGGRANLQQHQRMSLPHVSSSTCPYTLRAHKKPGEPSCATQANVQPKGSGKITKKKANSSKCRLLDFSTAAEEKSSYHVSAVNQLEGVHVSPVEGMRSAMDSCSPCDPSLAENVTARYVNAQDVTHSLDQSACEPALLIPCDTFSFDELFDLDLDSSLMTELEDLTALTVNAADLSHGPNSSATSAGLSAMDSSPRTVLTDIANMVHSDESENITERSLSPLASPSKHRKSTRSGSCNNLDKENSPAVGISSSLQAPA